MPRIEPIEMIPATGNAAEPLTELPSRGGDTRSMVRAMANAPAAATPGVAVVVLQLLTGALDLIAGIEPAENGESPERKESSVSMYLTWAAATGAAGCGRCATAV